MRRHSVTAHDRLAEQGLHVDPRLLRYWRTRIYPERYRDIADTHAVLIEQVIVQQARETALLAAEVERIALEETRAQIERGELKDASTAARNAATVKGINVDKFLGLSGRPTHITETRDAAAIIRSLRAKGVRVDWPGAIDGTAEEE